MTSNKTSRQHTSLTSDSKTLVLRQDEPAVLALAVKCLEAGGLVVVPTETFYGIAASPQSAEALERLMILKERPAEKALTLIAADTEAVGQMADLGGLMQRLAKAHWPGPLTLVLPTCTKVADALTTESAESTTTVAVRVPGHFWARALAKEAGGLITATSANRAGCAPPQRISELDPAILEGVDLVIDGGELRGGLPSTLVGASETGMVVYRAGALAPSTLLKEIYRVDPSLS